MYASMKRWLVSSSEMVLFGNQREIGREELRRDVAQRAIHRLGEHRMRHHRDDRFLRPQTAVLMDGGNLQQELRAAGSEPAPG